MMKVIDIGHRKLSVDEAISELEATVSKAHYSGQFAVIKVIHGHGTGALKRAVRNWCHEQIGRFQSVIHGEDYDLFNPESAAMRRACQHPDDPDLGRHNSAVTYIWLW
jgi:hypothetical protein